MSGFYGNSFVLKNILGGLLLFSKIYSVFLNVTNFIDKSVKTFNDLSAQDLIIFLFHCQNLSLIT